MTDQETETPTWTASLATYLAPMAQALPPAMVHATMLDTRNGNLLTIVAAKPQGTRQEEMDPAVQLHQLQFQELTRQYPDGDPECPTTLYTVDIHARDLAAQALMATIPTAIIAGALTLMLNPYPHLSAAAQTLPPLAAASTAGFAWSALQGHRWYQEGLRRLQRMRQELRAFSPGRTIPPQAETHILCQDNPPALVAVSLQPRRGQGNPQNRETDPEESPDPGSRV